MKISIVSIGKFENSPFKQVFENYLKRMKWTINLRELDLKNAKNYSVEKLKEEEGNLILENIKPSTKLIALDKDGKEFSSIDFSKMLANSALNGESNLAFIIGGSDGLSKTILNKANLKISLGKMTFPHLMVRGILIEQLYRAQSIIEGHPYHR